jgi:hypothetical protein
MLPDDHTRSPIKSSHRFVELRSYVAFPAAVANLILLERCVVWGVSIVLPMLDPRSAPDLKNSHYAISATDEDGNEIYRLPLDSHSVEARG